MPVGWIPEKIRLGRRVSAMGALVGSLEAEVSVERHLLWTNGVYRLHVERDAERTRLDMRCTVRGERSRVNPATAGLSRWRQMPSAVRLSMADFPARSLRAQVACIETKYAT